MPSLNQLVSSPFTVVALRSSFHSSSYRGLHSFPTFRAMRSTVDLSRCLPYNVYRKRESRSRSCPRRFSAGHSNQDWSENATQWRQISSGISVTHRGMVAGAGRLCAWTASKPDGYFRGVRCGCWNGPTVRVNHWILRFAQAGMAGPARGTGRGSNTPTRRMPRRHVVRSGGRRFWVPNSSSAVYRRIVVNNCGVYGDRQLSDSCRRSVIKRARIHML